MSTTLYAQQITGNSATTAHDMLFVKQSAKTQNSSVFGQGYFQLSPPAKTFRSRNQSMMAGLSTNKQPMHIRKNLKQANGFNYSFRKFHLQSKDYVDRFLPTNPSVANFAVTDENGPGIAAGIQDDIMNALATAKRDSLFRPHHRNNSLPPQSMKPIFEEQLPELNATRAKIEQHIYKTPLRNVSILISRNSRIGLNESGLTTKTPSYMRDPSQQSLNEDIQNSTSGTGKLPVIPLPIAASKIDISEMEMAGPHSENTLIAKFPVKSKVFQLNMVHKSPHELLQERLIEKAVEKHSSILRTGTDLKQILQLSTLTVKNRKRFNGGPNNSPLNKDQSRVIFSPKAMGSLTPLPKDLSPSGISSFGIACLNLKNMSATPEQQTTMPLPSKQSTAGISPRELDFLGHRPQGIPTIEPSDLQSPKVRRSPKALKVFSKNSSMKGEYSSKHSTVAHVPSPRISRIKDLSSVMEMHTTRDKFMDTQRIPFQRASKLSNNMHSKADLEKMMVKGSSGQLSLEGSDAKKIKSNERDAFLDFSRTGQSNMQIKLDPVLAQTKTSINIKDIDFGKQRAKLKITTSKARSGDSRESLISRDSQPKDDDDDYYEEMQLRSKLKPNKKKGKKQKQKQILDQVETEGHNSNLDRTMSVLSQNMRISNLSKVRLAEKAERNPENLANNSNQFNRLNSELVDDHHTPRSLKFQVNESPSMMQLKRQKQSALVKEGSRGALTIMNVTFNDKLKQRKQSQLKKTNSGKIQHYITSGFNQSTTKRFDRIKQLNEEMKQTAIGESSQKPGRQHSQVININSNNFGTNESINNTKSSRFGGKDPANGTTGNISPLQSVSWRKDQQPHLRNSKGESVQKSSRHIKITNGKDLLQKARDQAILSIQGKEAHLERRSDSPFLSQAEIDKVSVVKVKIANKPTKQQEADFGRTQKGDNIMGRASSLTVENIVDEAKGIENNDLTEDESPTPLGMSILSQPKLNKQQSQSPDKIYNSTYNSSKNNRLTQNRSQSKQVVPVNNKPFNSTKKKRNSALEKTNGGVEPWIDSDKKGLKQQSLLSFANLQADSDEDIGPVVNDEEGEFLLNKDPSVQKIKKKEQIVMRSSQGGTTQKQHESSKAIINKKQQH